MDGFGGGPRLDGALAASSGRTATTTAMGKGSTQFQHLVQTEVPPSLLQEWLSLWTAYYGRTLLKDVKSGNIDLATVLDGSTI